MPHLQFLDDSVVKDGTSVMLILPKSSKEPNNKSLSWNGLDKPEVHFSPSNLQTTFLQGSRIKTELIGTIIKIFLCVGEVTRIIICMRRIQLFLINFH